MRETERTLYFSPDSAIMEAKETLRREADRMPDDLTIALDCAPIIHFDENETIPVRAVGYTVFRETAKSVSFPGRTVNVPQNAAFTVEYAYYFDYDIEHMYDLEHIWVTVGKDGEVLSAEGSFHGKYLVLLVPGLHGSLLPAGRHVHAFCQPGKHAFLPAGDLFRIVPRWDVCCLEEAGGPVLIGNPFCAAHSPTGKDLFKPTAGDDARSRRYIKENLSFRPSLRFRETVLNDAVYMPWRELFDLIPGWIGAECGRLRALYGEE